MKIDGKALADKVLEEVEKDVWLFHTVKKRVPSIVVLQVGDNPASNIYVANKRKACERTGILFTVERLDERITTTQMVRRVEMLNNDSKVDGILVQMPLPQQINADKVLDTIAPEKDVDGLTIRNQGELFKYGTAPVEPCTAYGVLEMLYSTGVKIAGLDAVVIGRSELAGMPIARMLMAANATVTLCHSHTKNVAKYTRAANLVVTAVGKPDFLTADMINSDSVVIDVGINRVGNKTVGDCAADVADKAFMYSPVPGGVGPMTVAMCAKNVLRCAEIGQHIRELKSQSFSSRK